MGSDAEVDPSRSSGARLLPTSTFAASSSMPETWNHTDPRVGVLVPPTPSTITLSSHTADVEVEQFAHARAK